MKTNKLKVFFISGFIALLISFATKAPPTINSSAVSPPSEIYAPKSAPPEYSFETYNHCGTAESDLLLCAYQGKYTYIIYSNSSGTFVSHFDKDLYKIKDIKLLDNVCISGAVYNEEIYLIDRENFFVLNKNLNVINTLTLPALKNLQIISNKLYLFCSGDFGIENFDYGFMIFSNHDFACKYESYFLFQSENELYITNFDRQLIFETSNFVSATAIDDTLVFATTQDGETIVTCIKNFEITYTSIFDIQAEYADFDFEDNGLNIYLTADKTYKYFICNHGDIISRETFSDKRYISVKYNIYTNESYVFITINNRNYSINDNIYSEKYYVLDDMIIFNLHQNLETYGGGDVYIAKFSQ